MQAATSDKAATRCKTKLTNKRQAQFQAGHCKKIFERRIIMSEARIKILELLQEGKVSVDEAMQLLRQVPDEDAPKPRVVIHSTPKDICTCNDDCEEECTCDNDTNVNNNNNNNNNNNSHKNASFYGLDGIGETIRSAVNNALEAVDDVDISINLGNMFGSRNRHILNLSSSPIVGDIKSLKILGKNAPVEIVGYSGNAIKVEVKYQGKRGNAQVYLSEEGGNYELLYDYNAMRALGVECYVPNVMIGHLHGESKNSKVELRNVSANDVELLTRNSKIEIEGVSANNITAKTSNSKIEMEKTKAKIARLTTSNSKIETEDIDVEQLYLKTSNSGIKVENPVIDSVAEGSSLSAAGSQYPPGDFRAASITAKERVIEATTSNGGVEVNIPQGMAVKLQASTSNGRVECKLNDLVVNEISKNFLSGKSVNYDTAQNRVKVNINTSNSTVRIKES